MAFFYTIFEKSELDLLFRLQFWLSEVDKSKVENHFRTTGFC